MCVCVFVCTYITLHCTRTVCMKDNSSEKASTTISTSTLRTRGKGFRNTEPEAVTSCGRSC